jgi:hypothetical protein
MRNLSEVMPVFNKLESLEAIAAGLKEHGIKPPTKLVTMIEEITEAIDSVLAFNPEYDDQKVDG